VKILITGATGFLGSHLCRRLAAEGHQVRAFCRPASDRSRLQDLAIEFAVGDLTDAESVIAAVSGCDAAVHAGAQLSYWSRVAHRQGAVNVEGTRTVARACRERGVHRLLHVSSVAAVGVPADPGAPAGEDFRYNLEGAPLPYHFSKRRAEDIVLAEVARGLEAVIVNPATIFGPHGDGYRGAEIVEKVRRRRIVPYFTGGFCAAHVDDVCSGILSALDRGRRGERYILGGENITFKALAERAARTLQLKRWFLPVGPQVTGPVAALGEVVGRITGERPPIVWANHYLASRYCYYDSTKACRELGYAPRDFEAILTEILRYLWGRERARVA
jgi:dihydroflavonol-4-reductase